MMAGELPFIRIGWRNLWRNPRRTLLTVLALGSGLALLLISLGLLDGSREQDIANYVRLDAGHVVVQARGYQDTRSQALLLPAWVFATTRETLRPMTQSDAVQGISPRLLASGLLRSAAGSAGVRIFAVEPAAEKSLSLIPRRMIEGAYLSEDQPSGVVIGVELARKLAVRVGSKVVLMTQAVRQPDTAAKERVEGEIQSALVRVVGIFRSGVQAVDARVIQVPLSAAQALLGVPDQVTQVAVFLARESDSPLVVKLLQARLAAVPAEILTWQESLPRLAQLFWLNDAFSYVTNAVLLLMVGLGVLNTLLMAVLERRYEFGVCAALGLRPGQLAGMVIGESLVLTVLSLALGLVLGLSIHRYLATAGLDLRWLAYLNFPDAWVVLDPILYSQLSLNRVVWSTGVVLMMAIVMSLYPAFKATQSKLSDAQREF
jgi:ABC-type lipoprotein release transport system permease subunit